MPRICNIINNMRELNMIDMMFDDVRSVQARKLKLSNPFFPAFFPRTFVLAIVNGFFPFGSMYSSGQKRIIRN